MHTYSFKYICMYRECCIVLTIDFSYFHSIERRKCKGSLAQVILIDMETAQNVFILPGSYLLFQMNWFKLILFVLKPFAVLQINVLELEAFVLRVFCFAAQIQFKKG